MTAKLKTLGEVDTELSALRLMELDRRMEVAKADKAKAVIDAEHKPRLDYITGEIAKAEKRIEDWLLENKKDFDKPPRSIELPAGTIGWRLGQPHVAPVSKKWTWKKILEAIVGAKAEAYFKTPPVLDREALQRDAAALGPEQLKEWGLKSEQIDSPQIDLKVEDEKKG